MTIDLQYMNREDYNFILLRAEEFARKFFAYLDAKNKVEELTNTLPVLPVIERFEDVVNFRRERSEHEDKIEKAKAVMQQAYVEANQSKAAFLEVAPKEVHFQLVVEDVTVNLTASLYNLHLTFPESHVPSTNF